MTSSSKDIEATGLSAVLAKLKRLPRDIVEALKKHRWTLAFIVACLLAFLGPTYGIYVLYSLGLSWPIPDITGFALFSLGLISVAYLMASKPESSD